ncbi:BMQ_0737 family morphogenetic spore coat protein [Paenisporosarcina antarctica]|uniref:Uncharacterized protein n=1 Tax=Paenisporosarcina antarctica TaxID=417367 RepID=A0A4P6ZUZ5_9BACL|nr:hypothetical protein [Paenisporosarcina antarctica]QBP40077.1 hypothetical protein E2636_02420 [Paenisporosarcina antarctica]
MKKKQVRIRRDFTNSSSSVYECFLSETSCVELLQVGGRAEQTIFLPDGTKVLLQRVKILTTGLVTVKLMDGSSVIEPFSLTEGYFLCAPPGTTVNCEITNVRCYANVVCVDNMCNQLIISISFCQDVKSETNVNVLMNGEFCKPRLQDISGQCLPIGQSIQGQLNFIEVKSTDGEEKQTLIRNDIIIPFEETYCAKASRVYDWIQRHIVVPTISKERACIYEVLSADGDCGDIAEGDLICLPCDEACEEFLVCNNQNCLLILRSISTECQFCPSDAKIFPNGLACEVQGQGVFNVEKVLFYPTIEEAVADAEDNNTLIVFPGEYNPPSFLSIDKPLTLRGLIVDQTTVTFPDSLINTTSLRIEADNVTIENLHFIGPTSTTSGDNALLGIPFKSFGVLYENITIRVSIIEGGRRNAFIRAKNLTISETMFIHTGNRNSLHIFNAQGTTNISENTFQGGPESRAAMTFEDGESGFTGTITIQDNTSIRHSQFVLFNLFRFDDVSLFVLRNIIDHQDRSGSSIIFIPIDFTEALPIIIEENEIINPNPGRLAVYVDFRDAGASVPSNGQIQVIRNIFDIALPWGSVTDTVDPNYPVGFSTNAPMSMSLNAFQLVGNIVINL